MQFYVLVAAAQWQRPLSTKTRLFYVFSEKFLNFKPSKAEELILDQPTRKKDGDSPETKEQTDTINKKNNDPPKYAYVKRKSGYITTTLRNLSGE